MDRYQSLINAGVRIPSFIEALTGISNAMIRQAPTATTVMREVSDFVGDIPVLTSAFFFVQSKFLYRSYCGLVAGVQQFLRLSS